MPIHSPICVYLGHELARYGFGEGHPFGPDRMDAFRSAFETAGLHTTTCIRPPVPATREQLELFHTQAYIGRLKLQSDNGFGYLDGGDTPAWQGLYEAACTVAGTVLDGVDAIVTGHCRRVFVPIAGLHHARRDAAAGFCAVNDCGIAIETLRRVHGVRRIAYVDIDAHHGDGVFYSFEDDPDLIFVDFHEDGRFLYPGTGAVTETGSGVAAGTKLNIPMPPESGDDAFMKSWDSAEAFIESAKPEIILFQCGADSIDGDPITHLKYSPAAHAFAAERLSRLADRCCDGRLLAMGGGGYNRANLAAAWTAVVGSMVDTSPEIP